MFLLGLKLEECSITIIGGGVVALSKLRTVLQFQGKPRIIAPIILKEIVLLANEYSLPVEQCKWECSSKPKALLTIVATDSQEINQGIAFEIKKSGALVVAADNIENSNCSFVALIKRANMTIGISSSGVAPVLAQTIKKRIEELFATHLEDLITILASARVTIKSRFPLLSTRRAWYKNIFLKIPPFNPTLHKSKQEIITIIEQSFSTSEMVHAKGSLTLVGAGPGARDLLTLRALHAIESADVILYDSLVSEDTLATARRDAVCINTGKRHGLHRYHQPEIHQEILKYTSQGLQVIRLKGGDPLLFAQASEELHFAKKHNIPFAVIPGISAHTSACAQHAFPITKNEISDSVLITTAHNNKKPLGWWKALVRKNQTVILYMSRDKLLPIVKKVTALGIPLNTPIACIADSSLSTHAILKTTFGAIAKNQNMLMEYLEQAKNQNKAVITIFGNSIKK
ncbi:MAG: uroporphyrinogen-III C-methyltransferase [Methylacidiphilales bacterium]|nr:uroporphyrinogen-III C-methyltransferase [Candidatus Methylacidiphilales bacterium]